MTYSFIAIVALLVQLILNADLVRKTARHFPAEKEYKVFLLSVLVYHATDALWGIFYEYRLAMLLYADTVVYFISMALSVLFWTSYVLKYLEGEVMFARVLRATGYILCALQIAVILVNAFWPVVFTIGPDASYEAGVGRHLVFGFQIVMFAGTTVLALIRAAGVSGSARARHLAIGTFGLAMSAAISAQMYLPLYPVYSVGYLLGLCILRTFVIAGEREEFSRRLADSLSLSNAQAKELDEAKRIAYTDPLTEAGSKHAYIDAEERINQKISSGADPEFAVAVFDLNDLKLINDTSGHETGDFFIITSCRLISRVFANSPVYRIGGDEFVVILEGQDYKDRKKLQAAFDREVEQNIREGKAVVSSGLATFDPRREHSLSEVFERADEKMYRRKRYLKGLRAE